MTGTHPDPREAGRADEVRRQLVELVSLHGPQILDDGRRVRAMLADAVVGATAETNLIGLGVTAGVPGRLRQAGTDPSRVREAVDAAVLELERTSSVQPRDARWAVETLAEALGLSSAAAPSRAASPPRADARPGGGAGPGPDDLVVRTPSGEQVIAAGTTAVIGRDSDNTIVIDSPAVSRQHVRLQHTTPGWELSDLGSTQGTFVDGVATGSAPVRGETDIVLGQGPESVRLTLVPFGQAATRTPHGRLRPAVAPAAATELPHRPGGQLADAPAARTELGGGSDDTLTVTLGDVTRTVAPGGTLVVGRDVHSGNDLIAPHSTVSRRHLTVQRRDAAWHLTDLDTTSGTWHDGSRVSDVRLEGRQEFVLGDRELGDRLVTQTAARSGGGARALTARGGRTERPRAAWLWPAVAAAAVLVIVVGGLFAWRLSRNDSGGTDAAAPPPARTSREDLARATVYIEVDDASGSGVIIDRKRGLVLTNAHLAEPTALGLGIRYGQFSDEAKPVTQVLVSVSDGLDQPAEPRFNAKVLAYDGYLDFAVLKLDTTLSGSPVDAHDLDQLSQVTLADSDDVRSSDPVTFFGYPAAADSKAPTYTTGVISGLRQDDRLKSVRALFNATATSSFGNSGGLAVDKDGHMIGVPTVSELDSNGTPVFAGIRPIKLALPVIKAAREGQAYTTPYAVAGPESATVTDVTYAQPDTPGAVTAGCANGKPGSSPAAAGVDYTGFPGGANTDAMAALYTESGTLVTEALTQYPTRLTAQGCLTLTFDQAVSPDQYELKIGVGGDLRVVYDKTVTFD